MIAKERPILFKPWKAAWIHRLPPDYEAQTRRIVIPPNDGSWAVTGAGLGDDPTNCCVGSPRQVGDRLWVKETFHFHKSFDTAPPRSVPLGSKIWYAGDNPDPYSDAGKLRVSIHMPRWASRSLLEITNVRAERVQDISEEDAIAEGVQPLGEGFKNYLWKPEYSGTINVNRYSNFTKYGEAARQSFESLWNFLNGKDHPWSSNPWVWVYTLRKI